MTPSGQTICLCMIVKNEAPVIRRCLASVRPLIDHWIVVDTGSTDGTQDVVRQAMAGIPGDVIERPWQDFATNRTESLDLARSHGDYSLVIDADDMLEVPRDFRMPDLDADSYAVDIQFDAIHYVRSQIVKSALPWRYDGVIHEYLMCDEARSSGHLPVTLRVNNDGARRRDPQTYRKDAALLERTLLTETDPFRRSRYTFYLAQSWRDCGETAKAVAAYLQRATMGFWQEEVFVSLYQAGRLMEALKRDPDEIIATYQRATDASPSRAEAAHAASRLCRHLNRFAEGYAIAKPAFGLPLPHEGLFIEPWVYHYGIADEYAVNAYWSGRYRDCLDGALRGLASGQVPAADIARFVQNARFALDRLPSGET